MMFKRLRIVDWRQYGNIDIEFHKKLTVITGANGAGKTTLLNILNTQLGGVQQPLVGVPTMGLAGLIYTSGFPKVRRFFESLLPIQPYQQQQFAGFARIGTIYYDNGQSAEIGIPQNPSSTYNFHIPNPQPVKGFSINSIRPLFKYEQVSHIPTSLFPKQQYYNLYKNSSNNRFYGNSNNNKNETYFIKETLLSWATYGPGNAIIAPNPQALKLFNDFEIILGKVLPTTLGFIKITIRPPEVVLVTRTGEFPIDAVSGGVASIIDLAWQIYMFDSGGEPFVVTIDEPENHLHPEIQKSLLPNMALAFSNCQFIVVTHSPFIITSMSDSNAYALKYNDVGKVDSVLLDRVDKSGSANDILKEVLGLEDTLPYWVDDEINRIIEKYKAVEVGDASISSFKDDLSKAGLGKYVPESLLKLLENYKKIN
ncbi:AAA family ATPase [Hymenobacter sp. BRD67]|uniref:AAA family ATPase n=1 Tax=Hymenobacter sp. BRD67 TaxID=2675877 RepID=UPI001565043C|nr:ATP-binding protein [Hymenobacter sp. BRD67]QKG54484.1 AAA family ATPase [Hymenobacter sp. BRD67]